VGTRLTDSRQYAHLWGTAELAQVFEERARLQSWLDILAALAAAQARLGIIPAEAAAAISGHARAESLDLDYVAEQTRRTAHSMLGLIRGLHQVLPESAREHVYVGATVQDVTDTWFALVMRDVVALVWRDLRAIEESLVEIAVAHRDTVMVGRTHGQPGSPITFGFKVASWADEVRRHLDRLREGRPRWLVGQLAGAVGVLGPAGGVLCRAGAGRSRDLVADLTRPGRGVRRCPVHDLRDAGAHRQRGLRTAASGDRGATRADHVRRGREHHHASQTQPGG
jgi:adenylosuccinate lyase